MEDTTIKNIKAGSFMYGAKNINYASSILKYTRKNERIKKNNCVYENMSWFSDLEQARSYATKISPVFKWNVKNPFGLVTINKKNSSFFKKVFTNTTKQLKTIYTPYAFLDDLYYPHPYLKMSRKERAYYEFKFAFGYLSVREQVEFMKMLKYLIKNHFIRINKRDGNSIYSKLDKKIKYYNITQIFHKHTCNNRLSFYEIDKYVLNNLCILLNKDYGMGGVYQPDSTSVWFPKILGQKMNIKEYILFRPHKNLQFVDMV
jgi:hypothetical protein